MNKVISREYVEKNFIHKDKIKKFIKDELPNDEVLSCLKVYDVNGVDIRRKLEKLLEEK